MSNNFFHSCFLKISRTSARASTILKKFSSAQAHCLAWLTFSSRKCQSWRRWHIEYNPVSDTPFLMDQLHQMWIDIILIEIETAASILKIIHPCTFSLSGCRLISENLSVPGIRPRIAMFGAEALIKIIISELIAQPIFLWGCRTVKHGNSNYCDIEFNFA